MTPRERLSRVIGDIATRRKGVTFDELRQIANQIRFIGIRVKERETTHGYQFTIGSKIVQVCKHNRGGSQIKKCYVDAFIDAMIELGLYEESHGTE